MEISDGNFRHTLIYYFRKGKSSVQFRDKLYDVYGEKSLTGHQCQNWFARFFSGEKLNISCTCVERHLKQLGCVNKLDNK